MFVGGMAGSTAGGLKVSRLVILVKSMLREVRTLISPRSVKVIKLDGQGLNDRVVSDVNIYFFTLMVLLAFSVLLLSLDNLDLVTAFTAAVTSINNVGPGLNGVGPFKSLDGLSNLSLLVLIFDMLVGRLEIFPHYHALFTEHLEEKISRNQPSPHGRGLIFQFEQRLGAALKRLKTKLSVRPLTGNVQSLLGESR